MTDKPNSTPQATNQGAQRKDPFYVTAIGCIIGATPQLFFIFQNGAWVESLNPYLRLVLLIAGLGFLTIAVGLSHVVYGRLIRR